MASKDIIYSETFYSIQGEGTFTGRPTVWVRLFGCNLECNGFGQRSPDKPETYELPYAELDITGYTSVEQLPVFTRGCDSSYSWSKKFRHLNKTGTASDICDRLEALIPNKRFWYEEDKGNQDKHLCFTGGEPFIKRSQKSIVLILEELIKRNNTPLNITFETNGSKELIPELKDMFYDFEAYSPIIKIFFSVSPKLFSVTGEIPAKAIKPEVVKSYNEYSDGQLKFVVNGTEKCWQELESVISLFRSEGVKFPVWIMPVGGTVEGLNGEIPGHMNSGDIANEALRRGYNVAARVHAYLFGNKIGT
jgi:7-carboxy-7-deazaguanine synthase